MTQFYKHVATASEDVKPTAMRRSSTYANPLHGDVRPPSETFGAKGPMKRQVGRGSGAMGSSVRPPMSSPRLMPRGGK